MLDKNKEAKQCFCLVAREVHLHRILWILVFEEEGEVWSFVICLFVLYILFRKLCTKKDKFYCFGVL